MRDFFILALEKPIAVIIVLVMIAVLASSPQGGAVEGLATLVGWAP